MEETSTTAMLVGTRDMFDAQPSAVTATVPRQQVEAALTVEPPAELVLEILRGNGTRTERRIVNVAWQRADLESVLGDREGDAITFAFDPTELERALDEPDVEGHGIREAAVVLSIAAVAAAGTGAAASAQPDPGGASSVQVMVGGHDEATLAERGIGVQTAAVHDEASLAARGIEPGTVAASHDEASLAARGIEPGTVAASHDEASYAARGIEPGYVAASHDEASLAARGIGTGAEPVSLNTESGFEMPSVDPATVAGIAGGLAGAGLLIAAATFATRRRQPGPA